MRAKPAPERPDLAALLKAASERYARMSQEERSSMYARQALGYVVAETVLSVYEPEGRDQKKLRDGAIHTLRLIEGMLDGDPASEAKAPNLMRLQVVSLTERDKEDLLMRISKDIEELSRLPLP